MEKASRNRTLTLSPEEETEMQSRLIRLTEPATLSGILDKTICQDLEEALPFMTQAFADLLIIDPPYNLCKLFGDLKTKSLSDDDYLDYVMAWLPKVLEWLKPNGSIYICCDWKSSPVIYKAMQEAGIILRNRITWQREKGRGCKDNWKNGLEDILYGVRDPKDFYFNVEAVKQRKRVIAPYRTASGEPKDWEDTPDGKFRMTLPSNFWDDISIPYWSMSENTDHPTQKPEKLMAKLILASCPEGGIVADPFLGSGTTSVTAQKLGRHYVGIERNPTYACWAEKRLDKARTDKRIQGYQEGVFWERNSQRH